MAIGNGSLESELDRAFEVMSRSDEPREEDDEIQVSAAPTASEDMYDRGISIDLDEEGMKQLTESLSSVIETHLEARQPQEAQWEEEDRAFLARPKNERKNWPLESSSNVTVPYIQTRTNQIVARIMQAIFATQPHWTVTQVNERWAPFAKPVEQYLDFCQRHMWSQKKVVKNFVQELCKKGTSILAVDWRDEMTFRYDLISRQTVPAGRKKGPNVRWVPRADFLMPIGYVDPSEAPWCAERMAFSAVDLRSMEYQKIIENVDPVLKAEEPEPETRMARRFPPNASEEGMPISDPENDAVLYFIWKIWFRRDLDGDGYPEDYIALIHPTSKTVLRLRPNPYPTAMRPYVVGRFIEVEGEFDGLGTAYVLRDSQAELSTIHNQRRDNATLANTRMYKSTINGSIGDTIRPRHGLVLKMMNPQTDLMEMKLFDMRQVDAFEENIVRQAGDEAIGMNDVSNAQVTSPVGRAAATTIMAVLQEGSRRFDLNTSEIRDALSEEAHQVVELFQTHGLPEPDEPLSPESFFGQGDERAVLVRQIIGVQDDIRGLMKIKLNASTAAINKEIEKQSAMQLYQTQLGHMQQATQVAMLIANPETPAPVKAFLVRAFSGLDENLKQVFQSFDRFDLESTLVGDALGQVMQESLAMQMNPGVPGIAGPPGAPPQGGPPGGMPPGGMPPQGGPVQ